MYTDIKEKKKKLNYAKRKQLTLPVNFHESLINAEIKLGIEIDYDTILQYIHLLKVS